jgi:hypothetical protein
MIILILFMDIVIGYKSKSPKTPKPKPKPPKGKSEYSMMSPSGSHLTVKGITPFLRDVFGSNPSGSPRFQSSFSEMFSGIRVEEGVRGWLPAKKKAPKGLKVYSFVSPSGAIVKVTKLEAFCKDIFGVTKSGRGKYLTSFSDMVNNDKSTPSVQGWTLL